MTKSKLCFSLRTHLVAAAAVGAMLAGTSAQAQVNSYSGNIDPFYETDNPLPGTIDPFCETIASLGETTGPFGGNIDPFRSSEGRPVPCHRPLNRPDQDNGRRGAAGGQSR